MTTVRVSPQYGRDVAASVRWMASSPDRIQKAMDTHTLGAGGFCVACVRLAWPCLTRKIADEALNRRIPTQRR